MLQPRSESSDCGRQRPPFLRLFVVEIHGPKAAYSAGESRLSAETTADKVEEQALATRCKITQRAEWFLESS